MMQAPVDILARRQQEMAEQAAADERARANNINTFERMWLTLGADVIRAANSNHRAELDEALGLATSKWSRLLDAEAQIQREEQQLASRPKERPTQPADDMLPDRTIEQQGRAWEDQTKHLHTSLAELRKLAKAERDELESYIARR